MERIIVPCRVDDVSSVFNPLRKILVRVRRKRFHIGVGHYQDLGVLKRFLVAKIFDVYNSCRDTPLDQRHRYSVEIGELRILISVVHRVSLEHQRVAHKYAYALSA